MRQLQLLRQNETGSLKGDVDQIMRNLDNLNQKLAERIASLKADVSMDLNNHKTEARDVSATIDLKVQEVNHHLILKIADLKTKMETLKMDTTRNIVWVALLSFAFILVAEFSTSPPKKKKASEPT
ncbi:hypothetical protein HK101_009371 [Irineochytrium annulatum]|nr:hypothetical protein HK101_009371 [Irineochytrium annulatum]